MVLQASDAERLAVLHRASDPRPWSARAFADALTSDTPHLALGVEAPRSDTLDAVILVQITPQAGDVLALATHPHARRQGLARTLLQAVCRRLGERGIARLQLDVAADNTAAITLYRALGFQVDGHRRGYYPGGEGGRIDALLMSLEFGVNSGQAGEPPPHCGHESY